MYLGKDVTPAVRRRQRVELRIVWATVRALLAAGFTLNVDDGDGLVLPASTADFKALHKALYNTDEDYLFVYRHHRRFGWVRFVYGNDGWDVINDHTVNLEHALKPVQALIDKAERACA